MVSYGPVRAVKGVSLQVDQGSVCAILGANGAGKSSIIRAVMGVAPREGTIEYQGEQIQTLDTHKIRARGIAWVPEGRDVFSTLTVRENLLMGAFTERDEDTISERLSEMYARFPRLKERDRHRGGQLSGGEQQMLVIARALMVEPELLLMDEPSLGLAPQIVEEVFSLVRDINAQGISILMVEQNAKKALGVADDVYVLEDGQIAGQGTSAEMSDSEVVQRAYLGG